MPAELAPSSAHHRCGECLRKGRLERAKGFEPSTPTLAGVRVDRCELRSVLGDDVAPMPATIPLPLCPHGPSRACRRRRQRPQRSSVPPPRLPPPLSASAPLCVRPVHRLRRRERSDRLERWALRRLGMASPKVSRTRPCPFPARRTRRHTMLPHRPGHDDFQPRTFFAGHHQPRVSTLVRSAAKSRGSPPTPGPRPARRATASPRPACGCSASARSP